MLNDNWDINFKAQTDMQNLLMTFEKDPTGWEGNCCVILHQDGDTIHLMPEHVIWLKDKLQDVIMHIEQDGYILK